MTMKIKFEHVFIKGVHKVKIVKFNVLDKDALPVRYAGTLDETQCYTHKPFGCKTLFLNEVHENGHKQFNNYREGEVISLKEKEWILTVMQKAGHRLYEINNDIAKEKEQWEGKVETYKF